MKYQFILILLLGLSLIVGCDTQDPAPVSEWKPIEGPLQEGQIRIEQNINTGETRTMGTDSVAIDSIHP